MDQFQSYKYNKDYNGIQQFRRSLLMSNQEKPSSQHRDKKLKSSERQQQQSSSQMQSFSNIDYLKDDSNILINHSQFNNTEVDDQTKQILSQLQRQSQKQIHQKKFLPFIQERDSVGRLIQKNQFSGHRDGSQSEKIKYESYKQLLNQKNAEVSQSPKSKGAKQIQILQVNELLQNKQISISQPQSSSNLQEQSSLNFQKGFTINQDKIRGYCNVIDRISPLSKQIAAKRASLQNGNLLDFSTIGSRQQSSNNQSNTHKRNSTELNLASMIFRNLSVNHNNNYTQRIQHQDLQNTNLLQNYDKKPQKKQLEHDFSTIEVGQVHDKSQVDKSLSPLFEINNQSILSEIKNNLKDKKNFLQVSQSLDRQNKTNQNTSKSLIKLQNTDNCQSVINLSRFKLIKVDPNMHKKILVSNLKQKVKQQNDMHTNYFFNTKNQPQSQNHSEQQKKYKFQSENEENFTELFKGVKVSQQQIDRFIKNELSYFGNIQKNDEEKIANFSQENVSKFMSDIQILKNRARKLKKNINQMSENAMNNLNDIDSQYNYKYSIPIEF